MVDGDFVKFNLTSKILESLENKNNFSISVHSGNYCFIVH